MFAFSSSARLLLPLAVFISFVSADASPSIAQERDGASGEEATKSRADVAEAIVAETNAFRKENELAPLKTDPELQKAARGFADFMARNDKYGHHADGRTPAQRAKAAGYEYCVVRENIAYRSGPQSVSTPKLTEIFFEGWKDSPEHRDNMLADYVTETAVAISTTDGDTYYAVQLFGRPRSAAIEVQIANETEQVRQLHVETDNMADSFKLPPLTELQMTRCLPTQLRLKTNDEGLMVNASKKLVIRAVDDNGAELVEISDE